MRERIVIVEINDETTQKNVFASHFTIPSQLYFSGAAWCLQKQRSQKAKRARPNFHMKLCGFVVVGILGLPGNSQIRIFGLLLASCIIFRLLLWQQHFFNNYVHSLQINFNATSRCFLGCKLMLSTAIVGLKS